MKKKLMMVVLAMTLIFSLTACGKFTCDFCGEEKSGKSYTKEVFGEKVTICSDCYADLQDDF